MRFGQNAQIRAGNTLILNGTAFDFWANAQNRPVHAPFSAAC
jgi:hypothetical protein